MVFVGNRKCVMRLEQWMRLQVPKSVLLYGPPGIGKTLLVTQVCERYGLRLFRLSCDSFDDFCTSMHNVRADQGIFGSAGTIQHQHSAILIEQVSSFLIYPRITKHLLELLKTTSVPLFMTNDCLVLRKQSILSLAMEKIPRAAVFAFLLKQYPDVAREKVARAASNCGGDVRYAKILVSQGIFTRRDVDLRTCEKKLLDDILRKKKKYSFAELCDAYNEKIVRKLQNKYLNRCNADTMAELAHNFSDAVLFSSWNQRQLQNYYGDCVVATSLWSVQTILEKPATLERIIPAAAAPPACTKQSTMTDYYYTKANSA